MKHLKNILIIFVVSIVITFVFDFASGGINSDIKELLLNILYGFLIGGTLSLTGFITRFIFNRADTHANPVKTYIFVLISIFLYISIDVFAINSVWFSLVHEYTIAKLFSSTGFILTNILTIFIGIIIFFIIFSKSYMTQFVIKEKEAQKSKNEAIKFQYKALQTQVNPHFLFNSLNTLSSMISIEPQKAEDFVNHLSKLYRYVLENKENELVDISEEILFIKNYIVLQKYRFENNIIFDIEKSVNNIDGQIIPMSLQLLVENAIKHNIISDNKKLNITITIDENNFICVINNIQLKEAGADSFNIGIKNIEERYSFITEQRCVIENDNNNFKVKLPIIGSAEKL